MDQLIVCNCRHTIESHGADGCDVSTCPCELTAPAVLDRAVTSARTVYGQWSEAS